MLRMEVVVVVEVGPVRCEVDLGRLSVVAREMMMEEVVAAREERQSVSVMSLWRLLPRARQLGQLCYSRGCWGQKEEGEVAEEEQASGPERAEVWVPTSSVVVEVVLVELTALRLVEAVEEAVQVHLAMAEELKEQSTTACG